MERSGDSLQTFLFFCSVSKLTDDYMVTVFSDAIQIFTKKILIGSINIIKK